MTAHLQESHLLELPRRVCAALGKLCLGVLAAVSCVTAPAEPVAVDLLIDHVQPTATGVVLTLRRTADGAPVRIDVAQHAAALGPVSLAQGTSVQATSSAAGVIYSVLGEVLAFTPSRAGEHLLDDDPAAVNCARAQGTRLAQFEHSLKLADLTQRALNASGARVVFLAWTQQDMTRFNVRYSHLALAYLMARDDGSGVWRVVHKRPGCARSRAELVTQGLGRVFQDKPWRHEMAWVIPSQEVQDRLAPLLRDALTVRQLHTDRYSSVSYVWSDRYQNTGQWVLETLALAMADDVVSRRQAQEWLQLNGYQPSVLRLKGRRPRGTPLSAIHPTFDDFPNGQPLADRLEVVTADSAFRWLRHTARGSAPVRLVLP